MKIAAITPDGKQDYLVELVIEGFKHRKDQIIATDKGNGINTSYDDDSFIAEALTSDIIVVFFGKVKGNRPPRHYLLDDPRLSSFPKNKICYIDGSEWCSSACELPNQAIESLEDPSRRRGEPWLNKQMVDSCGTYYKRETYLQDLENGIIPFLFGMSLDRHIRKPKIKDIDLFCSFGQTHTGLRKEIIKAVNKLVISRPDKKIVVGSGYEKSDFSDMLDRSRIVVDAWGAGDCCDRFWEAVGARACCLYQCYNILIPNRLVDYQHAVSYSTVDEFVEEANFLLDNQALTEKIANAGFIHANYFHTSIARANQIAREHGFK